jgi:high-affinity Fe2+/Pb2+ permease
MFLIILFALAHVDDGLTKLTRNLMFTSNIDWLETELWNSNDLLPEQSTLGQFIKNIFGYRAKPQAISVIIFMFSACPFLYTYLTHFLHSRVKNQ